MTMDLTIRWASALPIKQAFALRRYGKEAGTSPEATKYLSRQEEYYIAQVEGLRMPVDKEALKAACQLHLKNASISPVLVDSSTGTATPGSFGPPPTTYFLVFPKNQPSAHQIKIEDDEMEIAVEMQGLKFKRKFKLKDMVFEGKLEI
jgi:hypothetical protein